jgi:uncharacterized protein (DUF433 family)
MRAGLPRRVSGGGLAPGMSGAVPARAGGSSGWPGRRVLLYALFTPSLRYTVGVDRTDLYAIEPIEIPRYSVAEAARYLRMSDSTLKSWVAGRNYPVAAGKKRWEGLIHRPDLEDGRLSFSNLIEAHVLLALRRQYRVRMPEVRMALETAREKLNVERVLLSQNLRVTTGNVFLEHLGKLINLGRGGQGAMPEILQAYLERIEWDQRNSPVRIFPLTQDDYSHAPRLLAIDPVVAFGRPVIERKAITTSVVAERFFKARESIQEIAEDYDLEAFEVEEAIRYETPAKAA